MIAKFKPVSRLAFIGSATVLITLGGVTFTQAELATQLAEPSQDGFQAFLEVLEAQDRHILAKKSELEKLRAELWTQPNISETNNPFGRDFEPIEMQRYASLKIEVETQWVKQQKLLNELQMLQQTNEGALRLAIATTVPDSVLGTLLQNYNQAKTKLATLQYDLGTNHPDVQRKLNLVNELNTQIDDRVMGVLEGLRTHAKSLERVIHNAEAKMEGIREAEAKIQETEAGKLNIPEAWWPYLRARADLDRLKKFRDILSLRLAQEETNAKAGHSDTIATPR